MPDAGGESGHLALHARKRAICHLSGNVGPLVIPQPPRRVLHVDHGHVPAFRSIPGRGHAREPHFDDGLVGAAPVLRGVVRALHITNAWRNEHGAGGCRRHARNLRQGLQRDENFRRDAAEADVAHGFDEFRGEMDRVHQLQQASPRVQRGNHPFTVDRFARGQRDARYATVTNFQRLQ